ncbi:hypothetical protein BN439_0547 [Erwinia amylovora Ea644]|nr:hypothetical protein BN439_0547 [Erwinia amylovora Ea644]
MVVQSDPCRRRSSKGADRQRPADRRIDLEIYKAQPTGAKVY